MNEYRYITLAKKGLKQLDRATIMLLSANYNDRIGLALKEIDKSRETFENLIEHIEIDQQDNIDELINNSITANEANF